MHIIFQCRICSIRNKCRNNQMDDNIFDKRLLKRNCFMINKHFNRHYIWIVINVILSKASPVFQEKNHVHVLVLVLHAKIYVDTRESQESHFIECVKCSTEKMCTVYIKNTHTHAQTHTNAVLVTIYDHILSIQPKHTNGLCVKIRESIALEH